MTTQVRNRNRRAPVTRHGKMVGGYVPNPIADAIEDWISLDPERTVSSFVRAAAKEKLIRDGIAVQKVTV